jgi:hypothetical protein
MIKIQIGGLIWQSQRVIQMIWQVFLRRNLMTETIMEIFDTIEKIEIQENNIQPTLLYNEGWMLRVILKWFNKNVEICHDISMKNGSKWYSEALLSSKFLPKFRGDTLAESYTHADGVYGDFIIGNNGFGDLKLKNDCRQFVIVEAKIFSKYSKGTKNAPSFNQAARNVACMCDIVENSQQLNIDDISFFTIIPETQIEKEKTFNEYINIDNIKQTVFNRVEQYRTRKDYMEKKEWYDNCFIKFCEKIRTKLLSWENIINFIIINDNIFGNKIKIFYEKCLKYNKINDGVRQHDI